MRAREISASSIRFMIFDTQCERVNRLRAFVPLEKKNEINERACARARAFPLAFHYDRIDSNEIPCSITGNIGDENVFANIQIVHKQVIIV